jgi:membrane-associated phospholipid phosphatase
LIVTVGKLITGRQRPSYDNGKDYWHWFPSTFKQLGSDPQPKYDAFPSGHTIAAWSVATVIAKQYKNYKIVPILAYTAATGVGLSRITQDAHWMSDVIIGAAMGYTIGSFIAKERKNTKWTLLPASNGKQIMLTGIYKL